MTVGESSFPIGRPVGRPTESPIATLMKLTLAGVLAFAAAAHAAQPAGLSEGWGMKLFVVVLLALVAAVSGFGSPPKDREAEAVREPRARTSYAASLGRAPSMPRTGWQPTSEGGTDPNNCVRRGPPHSPTLCEAASECSMPNGAQDEWSPTCRRRRSSTEDEETIVVGDEDEEEAGDDWTDCSIM